MQQRLLLSEDYDRMVELALTKGTDSVEEGPLTPADGISARAG